MKPSADLCSAPSNVLGKLRAGLRGRTINNNMAIEALRLCSGPQSQCGAALSPGKRGNLPSSFWRNGALPAGQTGSWTDGGATMTPKLSVAIASTANGRSADTGSRYSRDVYPPAAPTQTLSADAISAFATSVEMRIRWNPSFLRGFTCNTRKYWLLKTF